MAGKPVPLGDDTAVIELPEGNLLLATEVIYPPLVEAAPYLAGRSAVLANVNDVYAMGGYPIAIVDTILAPADQLRKPGSCGSRPASSHRSSRYTGAPDRAPVGKLGSTPPVSRAAA